MGEKSGIRMDTLKRVVVLLITGFMLLPTASAHFLNYSAVDSGEIRYGGSTQYTTAQSHSIDTWNALGEINIAPDIYSTVEDLTYGDYNDTTTTTTGYYDHDDYSSDHIMFNEHNMDANSLDQRKNTATHELGHALGLNHSYYPNVMYDYVTTITSLGSHDISDYNTLYP